MGLEPEATVFDEQTAEVYDAVTRREDTPQTVDFLAQLAGDGPVLELAVGTGRVALPLAERGIPVDGIDNSTAMVAKLRAKPAGDSISVTIGDIADVPVTGTYRLIYLVFNTLFNLVTQDDQVRCFENVAAHLGDDGVFVVEAFVPDFGDQYVRAEAIGADEVWLDVLRHDRARQLLEESHVRLSEGTVRLYPIVARYAWPSELDLMARIAGLRLVERWAGWSREPFTSASRNHVSVYGRR